MKSSAAFRYEKLLPLRLAIANGTYHVPAHLIADGILRRQLRLKN